MDADGAGPEEPDQVWTVFDGVNPYMDFDGDGLLKTRYLYGPGIDELFARIGSGEDPQWYLADRLGSVRQIVDGAGTILDEISYDSFGNILTETGPAQGDRFKFTGREYSPELGIYYYRARWYDPSSGRFISQDPIGFSAGDANLYRYVGNAPGDGTDPSGLARINIGNANDGRISVGYQGSWGLFYGSQELIGNLNPISNLVERNGKWVSLSKLERIASSWWGFKPDWDEYFKENGYDPITDLNTTYLALSIELGLYNETFINDFSQGMGQITDLYETAMWHYAGAGFACGGGGKVPSKPVVKPGAPPRLLGNNPRPGNSRIKTDFPGGEKAANHLFNELTSGLHTNLPSGQLLGPNGHRLRLGSDGRWRLEIPAHDGLPHETIHFLP